MTWQNELKENIIDLDQLSKYVDLPLKEKNQLKKIVERHPMSITRYYISLINWDDPNDPIKKIAIPSKQELDLSGSYDTSGEKENTKLPGLQHKYSQTALILSTNRCAMYCRYCFRKRMVGLGNDEILNRFNDAVKYIRKHEEINNVLISGGDPFEANIPILSGFNFSGGYHMTPEFSALLVGLVTYTAAFIAEVVRAGIQAVDRGQLEASKAIGLSYSQLLSLIIIPQALRVIIPPLISQYLNLTKNSSLAIFIGYPELFFIGKTTINQAGRAVQVFAVIMAVYLSISLITSAILNFYNRRIQIVER